MPEDTQINVIVQNEPDQIVNVQVSGSEDTIVYVNPEIYANGVSSVNGRIGMVSLSKDDVGLHEVENISIVATSGELNDKINNLNTGFASIVSGIYNSLDLQIQNVKNETGILLTSKDEFLNSGTLIQNNFNSANYSLSVISGDLLSASGDIITLLNSTGIYLYDEIGKITSITGGFASKSDLLSSSGNLLSKINNTGGFLQDQINLLNGSGFITGDTVRPSETGFLATKDDLFLTGDVLWQRDISYSGYLSNEIISLSGELNKTGINLNNLINNYSSGFNLRVFALESKTGEYYSASNPDGFITGFNSGDYLLKANTGVFYSSSNPSGFITGFNSGDYLLKADTGVFYSSSNPSGFITGFNSGDYLLKADTGVFYSSSNPSGFISSGSASDLFVNINGDNMSGPLGTTELIISGSGYLQFNDGAPAWTEGRVFYDTDSHSLSYYNDATDVTVNVGQEQIVRVSNGWSGVIPNGCVVYISGAQGNRPKVFPASSLNPTFHTHDILGVATHDITTQGYVTLNGIVNGLNTDSYSPGDVLYLSSVSGQFTNIYPTPPIPIIKVGTVTRQHANQGAIFVKIDNGHDISQAHDVYIKNPSNEDILKYNSVSGLWYNAQLNIPQPIAYETFEFISKNIKSYNQSFSYNNSGVLTSINYSNGIANVNKLFNYNTSGVLTSINISGLIQNQFNITGTNFVNLSKNFMYNVDGLLTGTMYL